MPDDPAFRDFVLRDFKWQLSEFGAALIADKTACGDIPDLSLHEEIKRAAGLNRVYQEIAETLLAPGGEQFAAAVPGYIECRLKLAANEPKAEEAAPAEAPMAEEMAPAPTEAQRAITPEEVLAAAARANMKTGRRRAALVARIAPEYRRFKTESGFLEQKRHYDEIARLVRATGRQTGVSPRSARRYITLIDLLS